MKVRLDSANLFDLDSTLCCGQAFRWDKQNSSWYGVAYGQVIKVKQDRNILVYENVDAAFLRRYFGLDDNLSLIYSEIGRDKHVEKALVAFKGLRILHQEPWECLISYICATYKNIPSIRRMLLALSKRFGQPTAFEKKIYYTFPTSKTVAEADLKDLRKCELGYRARYVSETAKAVCSNGINLEGLKCMSYEEAKQVLLELPGVGQKVADCVLLFSLEKLDAFPIDVWIKRAMLRHYPSHFSEKLVEKLSREDSLNNSQYKQLNNFGRKYFGKYAGYAQEYLYHYERTCGNQKTGGSKEIEE